MEAYFQGKGYTVTSASKVQQIQEGIDFILHKGDIEYQVEVKTEYRAESTGNVFWEMEVSGKPGWTQKYASDSKVLICILLPVARQVYIFYAKSLPRITEYVKDNFENSKRIISNSSGKSNKIYTAWGYLLPLPHLAKFAKMYTI